ncbi:hypothetical protein P879_11133 [Paragonimus westermani]|uniref:C2H2-type domain-containing protein n=1 Tax=Paragonimus westermani TaxID=34504 RepID=A0A8T0DF34_9TREM|nr:hypothetical protein P879_11133 [Paragonimus westermani]
MLFLFGYSYVWFFGLFFDYPHFTAALPTTHEFYREHLVAACYGNIIPRFFLSCTRTSDCSPTLLWFPLVIWQSVCPIRSTTKQSFTLFSEAYLLHTGSRPAKEYQCTTCAKVYPRRQSLQAHIIQVHTGKSIYFHNL